MLLSKILLSAAASSSGLALRIETDFGYVQAETINVQAAIEEGQAAQTAAREVLALPDVQFIIADACCTSSIWGDISSTGAPIYTWGFRRSARGQRTYPPNYVLRHEIGHDLFIRYLVPSSRESQYGGDAPDWLDEMAAIAFERAEQAATRRQEAGRYAREGTLLPLSRFLTMIHPELTARRPSAPSGQTVRVAPGASNETPRFYAMARAFYDFLVARTNSTVIVAELAVAFRNGEPLDRWLLARTGHRGRADRLEALDAAFLAWIASDERYAAVPAQGDKGARISLDGDPAG